MKNLFLFIYDLSFGITSEFFDILLGKHFDGIWHTSLVIFGQECFFGNSGIKCCLPKGTPKRTT